MVPSGPASLLFVSNCSVAVDEEREGGQGLGRQGCRSAARLMLPQGATLGGKSRGEPCSPHQKPLQAAERAVNEECG